MEAILSKEVIINKQLCRLIGIASFVLLTSLGAFVRIPLPFTPVPFTLQTLFVLLSGALLGGRLGAVAQASYIFLGMLGLPIFTGLGGITGGYLFGFVLASFFIGNTLKYSRDNLGHVFFLFCAADLILLVCGAAWLKVILGISIKTAFLIGILPFIPGDIIKAVVACGMYKKLAPRSKEIF